MSVQRKTLAKGSLIKMAEVGGTLVSYGRIESFTIPVQDYEVVEVPELNPMDDSGTLIDNDPRELGDEILGESPFTHYWDPAHSDAEKIDTWWANKTEITIQITTPHPTAPAVIQFNCKIKTLTPAVLAKKDYFKRTVTILRTSSITVS